MYDDADSAHADQRRIALHLHDDAIAALSVTRNNELEITSPRQLEILERAAQEILSLRVGDQALNDNARSILERVALARRWTWVDLPVVTALTAIALIVGIGAAVLSGVTGNIILAVIGGLVSSALLTIVVLRYRRQNWRIRAERIAPMIWQHGV